jgi:hypothetical protein
MKHYHHFYVYGFVHLSVVSDLGQIYKCSRFPVIKNVITLSIVKIKYLTSYCYSIIAINVYATVIIIGSTIIEKW